MCDYTDAQYSCQRWTPDSIIHAISYFSPPLRDKNWFRIRSRHIALPEGHYVIAMKSVSCNSTLSIAVICSVLLLSETAWALRCGNRLVKEGMHEAQVIAICGDPVATEQLGYVLRPYVVKQPAGLSSLHGTRHVYSGFHQELSVTQMVFNFGPHKLMRILRFEGGQLTSIKTAGYGYHERP